MRDPGERFKGALRRIRAKLNLMFGTWLLAAALQVDQPRINQAVDKGANFLKQLRLRPFKQGEHATCSYDELILYTLYHAGVNRRDRLFQIYLERIIEAPIESVYCAAMQAIVLAELSPAKYQWRIAQCGQFLVDNQAKNGQWHYGKAIKMPEMFKAPVTTGSGAVDIDPKEVPGREIVLIQRALTGDGGCNSNTQFAILGLRACMEAKVYPPKKVLELALNQWVKNQNADGGWGYVNGQAGYASMTAGGVGSVVILKHYLKEAWEKDPSVEKSIGWLAANFDPKVNAKVHGDNPTWFQHYALYGLERAGALTGRDKFGERNWYEVGAKYLLETQKGDGSWVENQTWGDATDDTCFAILFLTRATPPVMKVATGGGVQERQAEALAQRAAVVPLADGRIMLTPKNGDLRGFSHQLDVSSPNGTVNTWVDSRDFVRWTVDIPEGAFFTVGVSYSCAKDHGGEYKIDFAGGEVKGKTEPTGAWDVFKLSKPNGRLLLRKGVQTIDLRPIAFKNALMNLESVVLTPVK